MNSEEDFKDMTMYPEMMIKNPAISFIDKVDITDVEPNITTDFLFKL